MPDVVDGLTSDERRVLDRLTSGLESSEWIVEGDSRRYETLARMVRCDVSRYPLAEGEGNFGWDDYGPAEMVHTAARRAALADEIERFPHILVSGASGIPPHNLNEVIDATLAYIDDPAINLDGILAHVRGPDFPTGGVLIDANLRNVYDTGEGELIGRARLHVETEEREQRIVITELPPEVRRGIGLTGRTLFGLIGRQLNHSLRDISHFWDETDRRGTRIVLEIKKGMVNPNDVIDQIYAHTPLEARLPMRIAASIDGESQDFSLLELIKCWVKRRCRQRTIEDLRRDLLEVKRLHGDARRTTIQPPP